MTIGQRLATGLIVCCAAAGNLFGGGSGLNLVVVINTNSTNSLELGNYYCEKRGVPPQNVLRISWTGGKLAWTRTEFDTLLRAPLNAMLASRQLSNQIDCVLLSMDIPYRVTETTGSTVTSGTNSTTGALYCGFKPDGCSSCPSGWPPCNLAPGSTSAYAGSEGVFRQTPPISASSNSWLVMMLTSSNLAQAKAVVDRGVAGDFTSPTQTVVLGVSDDRLRNLRLYLFDDALLEVGLRGNPPIIRTNVNSPNGLGTLMGYQNGIQAFSLATSSFAAGALADSLTSFGGRIFDGDNPPHTTALQLLIAGATASYGTVVEPCAYFAKFPSSRNYFYQARGFTAVESYYLSVTNPYQGLLIGEPLAAPFAVPASGSWTAPPADPLLTGTTNLAVSFQSPDPSRPIQQVDLFVDGTLAQTVTNIAPRQGNIVYVTINGFQTNYTVPASATLKSVASNLTARLNATSYTNSTKVRAIARGDRIELRSLDITRLGENTSLVVSNHIGSAAALTTFLSGARTNFLDRVARGIHGYLITNSQVTLTVGQYLQCDVIKTNGSVVTVARTNQTAGEMLNNFAKLFFAAINTNVDLAGADGFAVENINMHEDEPYRTFVYGPNDHSGEFILRARTPGWPESQIQVALTGSSAFTILDAGTNRLDENPGDLYPRNHIYLTAGATNLAVTFPFNTTTNADGYHELTAVAYEGSHVRTQKRVALPVRIQNTPLAATFTCLLGGSNTALGATLQFSVAANTNDASINRIELFSTGGSWGVVSNLASVNFSLAATNLGLGLHPFFALVMRSDGKQYRTETKWMRIIGPEPPFTVSLNGAAPTLVWPATAGRFYEILSATNVTEALQVRDSVTPTNTSGLWSETNNAAEQRFYRVRAQ